MQSKPANLIFWWAWRANGRPCAVRRPNDCIAFSGRVCLCVLVLSLADDDPVPVKVSMLRSGTWTLSNLCRGMRGKPQPTFDLVRPALPTLAQLIYSPDDDVLTDACWALSYLSDGPNEKIQGADVRTLSVEASVCHAKRSLVEIHYAKSTLTLTFPIHPMCYHISGDRGGCLPPSG